MRTYDETFERVMTKKAAAEKEHKMKKKKTVSVCISVFAMFICAAFIYSVKNGLFRKDGRIAEISQRSGQTTSCGEATDGRENSLYKSEKTSFIENSKNPEAIADRSDKTKTTKKRENKTEKSEEKTQKTEGTTSEGVPNTIGYEGGDSVLREEARREDVRRIIFALSAVDEKDRDKIDIDKSFCADLYGDETGEEYLIMNLQGDTFYYEVTITCDVSRVISCQKIIR